jgi:hypothetical protein
VRTVRLLLAAMLLPAAATADPVPDPGRAYQDFVALNPPRSDVAVGALWVKGYGPTGPGTSPDNLETVRGLAALSTDRQLQLSLTAGLFGLLGIDPHLRDHFSAHFSDISIMRVKDPTKLRGPPDEPHILEVLKVGSLSVSSDHDLGLGASGTGWPLWGANGQATADRSGQKSLEARDMVVAFKVGMLNRVATDERRLRLDDQGRASLETYIVSLASPACPQLPGCSAPPLLRISKPWSFADSAASAAVPFDRTGSAILDLPVPLADGHGGLLTRISARLDAGCHTLGDAACRHVSVRFVGTRVTTLANPSAKGW